MRHIYITLAFPRQAIQKEGRFFILAKMGSYVDLVDQPWQTVAFVEAASTAALLFDFCLTFDSEVRWTWRRKWGIMRIAFVISRYLPIGTAAMYLYYGVGSTHGETPNSGTYMVVIGTMNALGAAAADVMLAAMVHAFCGHEKRTLIAISFFSIVTLMLSLGNFLVAQYHTLL